tara:strand:- start:1303 stop:2415 length:1113 start_codon:yes stop_codon:yes gene_type:complete
MSEFLNIILVFAGMMFLFYIIGLLIGLAITVIDIFFKILFYIITFKWLRNPNKKKDSPKTTHVRPEVPFIEEFEGYKDFDKRANSKKDTVKVAVPEKFTIKIIKKNLDYSSANYATPSINIKAIGKLPKSGIHIGSFVSVLDLTNGKEENIISSLDSQQEEDTSCYLNKTDLGFHHEEAFFDEYKTIGKIVPEFMTFNNDILKRKLKLTIRLFDWSNPPIIKNNKVTKNKESIFWSANRQTTINIPKPEPIEEKDKAREFAIKLGVAVAMADGNLCKSEGETINKWITKMIAPFEGNPKRHKLKTMYNKVFKDSFELANKGKLDFEPIANKLQEIDIYTSKIEALELSYRIMGADGVIDANEKKNYKNYF